MSASTARPKNTPSWRKIPGPSSFLLLGRRAEPRVRTPSHQSRLFGEHVQTIVVSSAAAFPGTRGVLKALTGLSWRVTAAVPHRWQVAGREEPLVATTGEDGGVRIVPITVKAARGRDGAVGRWDVGALRQLLKDVRPDLVHIDAEPTTRLAATVTGLCRRLDIPSVLKTWDSLPRAHSTRRRRYSLSRLGGLVAGTAMAADLIRAEHPRLPTFVIPDHVPSVPSSVTPRPDDRLVIGFAGRLIPERGLDLLFQACVKLPCSWTLQVLGTGPDLESLERLAERLGIASRITWHGGLPRSARAAIWPCIDAIAVPSRRTTDWVETKAPILLEAMSHGVAAVAADTGALPDLLGDAGIVVPEGDALSLTQALERYSAPRLRQEFGRAARQHVIHNFSPTAIAKRTAEAWTRVLGGMAPE